MRLLVVGGGGFVGGRTVRRALARGCRVTVLEAPGRAGRLADLAGSVAVLEGAGHAEALRCAQPDAVVWAAGHNPGGEGLARAARDDVAAAVNGNCGALAALLTACAETGVSRVVACGSSVVYGPASLYAGAVDEAAPLAPMTAYGLSKQLAEVTAEWARRSLALCTTTVRLPLVVGPGRWYGGAAAFLERLLRAALRGERAREEVPDGPFDGIHGDDAAECLLALAELRGGPPVLNLTGFVASWAEVAAALCDLRPGADVDVLPRPAEGALPLMDGSLLRATLAGAVPPSRDARQTMADALNDLVEMTA